MTDAAWRPAVDAFWADAFGCDRALFGRPGVHVVDGGPWLSDYQGLYFLRLDATLLVHAPSGLRARVKASAGDADAHDLFTRDAAANLAGSAVLVLGPSRHHYADAVARAEPGDAVRELGSDDQDALDALRHACGNDDWDEGGFGDLPARRFGIYKGRALIAAGNLTEWRGSFSDVGLVTHPGYRGRGHARAVTRAMTRAALDSADVVRYRALTTNAASLAVARREGFLPYGENIAVRLAG